MFWMMLRLIDEHEEGVEVDLRMRNFKSWDCKLVCGLPEVCSSVGDFDCSEDKVSGV